MNKKMEQMISQDLGVDVKQIREASWDELDRLPLNSKERAFRPKNMFIVGGNINLAENREMGMIKINLRNTCRKAVYKIKCLLTHKKTV